MILVFLTLTLKSICLALNDTLFNVNDFCHTLKMAKYQICVFFVLHTAYRTGFYNEYIEYITLRWILMIMTTKENVCSLVKFLSLFSLNQVMVTLKCRTIWILGCNKSKSYFTSCIWH